jgi:hypothetical protein
MKVEHIFTDQDKLVDPLADEGVHHIPFQMHYVILNAVIPFADEFHDGISLLVVGVKEFHIERGAAKIIPLGMDIIIVNLLRELKLTVLTSEKGRLFVFRSDVSVTPMIIWFYVVHNNYILLHTKVCS